MMNSEWQKEIFAAVERLIISRGYPMLQYVDAAYAAAQIRQAQKAG